MAEQKEATPNTYLLGQMATSGSVTHFEKPLHVDEADSKCNMVSIALSEAGCIHSHLLACITLQLSPIH